MSFISDFTLHGSSGLSVLDASFLDWLRNHKSEELGDKIVAYSWNVNGQHIKITIDTGKVTWYVLPDASGFICFERDHIPNNCTLLDVYGKERMRLTVPWQLTAANNPASNAPPTSFWGISEPYLNPADGQKGEFGVKAWVEFSGEYYFELDCRTGLFLWGKEIRF